MLSVITALVVGVVSFAQPPAAPAIEKTAAASCCSSCDGSCCGSAACACATCVCCGK